MKRKISVITTLFVTVLCLASIIHAAIIVDDNGVGFVGKGDVQLLFLWNNAQLQSCAATDPQLAGDAGCLRFELNIVSEVVTERSWVCTNSNNDHTQERERTTTTSSSYGGLVASVARTRNQVTGFNLSGGEFDVTPTSETDGPPLNSCPAGFWSLTTPAGDPVEVSNNSSKTLTVTDTRSNTSYTVDIE